MSLRLKPTQTNNPQVFPSNIPLGNLPERLRDGSAFGDAPFGSEVSKDQRLEWMREVFNTLRYECLSRDEKGLVKKYVEQRTGYSRAQVTRYITQYQVVARTEPMMTAATATFAAAPKLSKENRKHVRTAVTVLVVLLLLSIGKSQVLPRASLVFLNPESTQRITGFVPKTSRMIEARVASSNLPLFVMEQEVVTATDGVAYRISTVADTISQLLKNVAQRRAVRLAKLGTTVPVATKASPNTSVATNDKRVLRRTGSGIFVDQYPFINAQEVHAAAGTTWDVPVGGREGQILMIRNGKPVWNDFPYLQQIRSVAPQGPEMTTRAGGLRSGGGGGGGDSDSGGGGTTTTITNNTTTSADSGWTDGGAFIYLTTMTDSVGIGTDSPDTKLEVIGTISGAVLYAKDSLRSSGSLLFEGAASGASLYISSSFEGAGLTDCDAATTSKLLWDATTKRFSCGTDNAVGTGLSQATADERYVKKSGDTMTGALVIRVTNGGLMTLGLEVENLFSGAVIRAQTTLASSGSLAFEGAASGSSLYLSSALNGAGLVDCDTAGSSKLLWDATSGRFSCGSDQNTGTSYTAGQGLTLNGTAFSLSSTITGTLLEFQTVSGSLVYGSKTLASSGTLVFEGAASGSSLYVATSIQGAGLTDCDLATQTLSWDTTTGRFSCGTDADTTYTPGQGLALNGTVFRMNDTVTGSLVRAITTLASSGTLVFEGAASGSSLYLGTSLAGAGLTDCDTAGSSKLLWDATSGRFSCGSDSGTSYTVGQGLTLNGTVISLNATVTGSLVRAVTTLASSGTLVFEGAASGSSLYVATSLQGAGLTDCDLATQTLNWDTTTGRFSCGTDSDTTYTPGQGLTLNGTVFSLNSTVTGSLVRAVTTLASSGTLVFEGAASGSSLYVATSLQGAGLTDCDSATQTLAWDTTTGRFSCGTDSDTTYTPGQGLTLNGTVFRLNDTVSGSLVRAVTTLASSGTLVFEGAASGSSLYLGTSLAGAGLSDCDTAGTSKLLWDATSGRFSCGSDQNTGTSYTAGQGLTLNGTAFSLNTTITGSLVRFTTVSGSTVFANTSLRSSGSIVVSGENLSNPLFRLTNSGASTAMAFEYLYTASVGVNASGPNNASTAADSSASGAGSIAWSVSASDLAALNDGDADIILQPGEISHYLTAKNFGFAIPGGATINGIKAEVSKYRDTGSDLNDYSVKIIKNGTITGTDLANATTWPLDDDSYVTYGSSSNLWGTTWTSAQINSSDFGLAIAAVDSGGGSIAAVDHIRITVYYTLASSTTTMGFDKTDNRWKISRSQTLGTTDQLSIDSALDQVNITGTLSGAIVKAKTTLASSGTLVFEGAGSGQGLNLAGGNITMSKSGSVVFNEKSYAVDLRMEGDSDQSLFFLDASTDRVGIGTSAPKAKLDVIGTISGSVLYAANSLRSSGTLVFEGAASGSSLYLGTSLNGAGLTDCDTAGSSKLLWDATSGRFSCGSDQTGGGSTYTAGQGLTLNGTSFQLNSTITGSLVRFATLSGSVVKALNTLTSSGTLTWEGAASGSSLYVATSLQGIGLTDCTGGNKLLWTAATGRFSCGVDQAAGSGMDQNSGDARYVKKSGDTMTGALVIQNGNTHTPTGTALLNVRGVASGTTLFATTSLRTSGSLVFEGAATGSSLYLGTSLNGAGLTDCDTAGTSKLLWDATSGRFTCGTDTDTDTNTTYTVGQGLTLNGTVISLNATVTGSLVRAITTLASSGTLVFEGAASGSSLYLGTSLAGAGLTDCDLATQTLNWDTTTGRFSCGTDSDTTYTPGQGLTLNGTVFSLNSTVTGSLVRAITTLASSGTLVFEGAASGSSLYVATSLQGAGLTDCDAANQTLNWDATAGRFSCGTDADTDTTYTPGQGLTLNGTVFRMNDTVTGSLVRAVTTLASSGTLVFEGAASGSSLYVATSLQGAGLTDCDSATQTLAWDTTTGRFSCGTDSDTTYTPGQGLTLNGTVFRMNDTVTGSLVRAVTTLASSGTLVFEGAASGSSLYLGTSLQGAGLSDCDTAGTSKLLWDATSGRFSCGSDQNTGTSYTAGQGLTLNGTAFSLSSTITGTLLEFQTVSGSLVYGSKTLASSGTLVFEGAASGSSLYLGTSLQGAGLTDCDLATQTLAWDTTTGRFSCGTDSDTTYTAAQGLTLNGTVFRLNDTVTGSLVRAVTTLASSGTLVFEGAASGSSLYLGTSLVGAGLSDCDTAGTSKLLWDATSGRFSCGSDTDTNTTYSVGQGLTLNGTVFSLNATVTGSLVRAVTTLASSGTLVFEGAASGSSLYVATSLQGAGLTDCDAANQTLNWDTTTGRFSCGTDADTDTTYTPGQGLTLNGTVFRLNDTVTGSLVRAVTTLASSGTLVFEGAASGSSLYLGTSLVGAGLSDCDTAGTSKLLWDATSGRFSCGSDQNTGTSYSVGQGLTLNGTVISLNATVTGSLVRAVTTLASSGTLVFEGAASGSSLYLGTSLAGAGLTDCDLATQTLNWDTTTGRFSCGTDSDTTYTAAQGLTLNGTIFSLSAAHSGTIITATTTLASSGTLVFEGAASGSSLYVATSLQGAGLTDCDLSTQTLNWDTSTGRFSCGTDSDTTYTPGQGLTLNGTVFRMNDTVTGSLVRAVTTLASSGTLVFEGAASGSSLYLGTSLQGAGLVDCDTAGTSKLLWDATSGRFSCGSDQTGGSSLTAGQGLTLNGTALSLSATVSGTLLEFQTVSGALVTARTSLASSGTLAVEGAATVGGMLHVLQSNGEMRLDTGGANNTFTLSFYDGSERATISNDQATNTFSVGSDNRILIDSNDYVSVAGANYVSIQDIMNVLSDGVGIGTSAPKAMLDVIGTISGSTLYAADSLRSSGTLVFEGAASGSSLYLGTSLKGAGLVDCDTAATSKLLWDASTGRFSCGSDQTGGSSLTAGQGLTLNGTALSLSATISGTLLEFQTVSGSTVYGSKTLASSGTLVFEGAGSGQALDLAGGNITISKSGSVVFNELSKPVDFRIEGDTDSGLFFLDGSADRVGIGTIAPRTKFEVIGTMSGAVLNIGGGAFTISGSGQSVFNVNNGNADFRFGGYKNANLLYLDAAGSGTIASASGGLGIGTNSPITQLHVAGSVPAKPMGSGSLASQPSSVFVQGRLAFATSSGSDTLKIIDVSNGSSPVVLSTTTVGSKPSAVVVQGRYAYVTNFAGATLQIYDISNPAVLALTGSIATDAGPKALAVRGRFVYVVNKNGNTMQIFDIGDVTKPTKVGSMTIDNAPFAITVKDRYAYIAKSKSNQIQIVDVGNPAAPGTGSMLTVGTFPTSVAIQGRYLYVTNSGSNTLQVLDVAKPLTPTSVSTLASGNGPQSVQVFGRYAYVANGPAATFAIVNVSNPAVMSTVGTVSTGLWPTSLFGEGRFLYVVNKKSGSMQIFDIGGAYIQQLEAGGLEVAQLSVRSMFEAVDGVFAGSLEVGQSLSVAGHGSFGLGLVVNSNNKTMMGSGALTVTSKSRWGTGSYLNASGAILALDSITHTQNAVNSPHILFGYKGNFDVKMYRSGTGAMVLASTTGTVLTLDSGISNRSGSLLKLVSDFSSTDNLVFRVQADGRVYSDSAYFSSGADYAEWFFSTDKLVPGETVCIDITRPNAVKRCTREADPNLMGIVSTNPAFVGNTISGADGITPPGYHLIGLIGQVPAKAIVATGSGEAIRPGDSLTSAAIAGYVRKAKAGESTVGVALEGLQSGEGTVNVLISRRNQSLTVEAVESHVLETIRDMEIDDEVQMMVSSAVAGINVDDKITAAVENQVRDLREQTATLSTMQAQLDDLRLQMNGFRQGSGGIMTDGNSFPLSVSSLNVDDHFTAAGDSRFAGDLHVDGDIIAAQITGIDGLTLAGNVSVTGTLQAQDLVLQDGSVAGTLTIGGTLKMASGSLFSIDGAMEIQELIVKDSLVVLGKVTFSDLAVFLSDVDVRGELSVSNKQAGFAVIPKSGSAVTVLFGSGGFRYQPVVTASPDQPVLYAVTHLTQTGFILKIAALADQDIRFNWIALTTENPLTHMGTDVHGAPNDLSVFPLASDNIPVSSNLFWNACIRNITLLDSEGQPMSCSRYHVDYTWFHPDLQIEFLWNPSVTPPILHLPEGYNTQVTEDAAALHEAFDVWSNGGEEEVLSESSASSESSVSSASSEATSASSIESIESSSDVSESSASSVESAESSASSESSSLNSEEVISSSSSEETASSESSDAVTE